jgi:hypothetical protein
LITVILQTLMAEEIISWEPNRKTTWFMWFFRHFTLVSVYIVLAMKLGFRMKNPSTHLTPLFSWRLMRHIMSYRP